MISINALPLMILFFAVFSMIVFFRKIDDPKKGFVLGFLCILLLFLPLGISGLFHNMPISPSSTFLLPLAGGLFGALISIISKKLSRSR